MTTRTLLFAALLLGSPATAQAGVCEAHFEFEGNFQDSSGNGYHGLNVDANNRPIGGGGYEPGRFGQAMRMNGALSVVAPLDLHWDFCPKVTIAVWVRLNAEPVSFMQLVSTGYGAGPKIGIGQNRIDISGGGGLRRAQYHIEPGVWTPLVGTWDYEVGEIALHWPEGNLTEPLGAYTQPPQPDFWIGGDGYLSNVNYIAEAGVLIDDVRVWGRILSPAEIAAVQAGNPPGVGCGAGTGAPAESPDDLLVPLPAPGPTEPDDETAAPRPDPRVETDVADPELTAPDDLPEPPPSEYDPDTTTPRPDPRAERELADLDLTPIGDTPLDEFNENQRIIRENPPPPPPPVDVIRCDSPGAPTVQATVGGSFPADFTRALNQARSCGESVQVAALNGDGQWIVSTEVQIAHSDNLPSGLAERLAEFENNHGGLDAAEIANNGAWLIVAGNEFAEFGIRSAAKSRVQSVLGSGGRIRAFSINPVNDSRWLLVDDHGNVFGEHQPAPMLGEIAQLQSAKRIVHEGRYMPNGSWVLLGSDLWFTSDGLTDTIVSDMGAIRRNGRRIEHVLIYGSPANYMILSNGPEPSRSSDPIWRTESNVKGTNLWARMRAHKITGVQVAMVRNNTVEWARGYGLRVQSDLESYVRPDTTFDVASVSKPIAAFGMLQLVEDGKVDLERNGVLEDIEQVIPSLKRPRFRRDVRPEAGNLIHVLQHCASFCYEYASDCRQDGSQGGAGTYSVNANLPTISEIILGSGKAKSGHKILRTANFGISFDYTSANYMLIQALIEIHGGSFLGHMGKLLSDLDMVNSTYATPYANRNSGRFARGHERNGIKPMYAYPEMAAASLVSTATDIARFIIAVNKNGQGLLSPGMVDKFLGRDATVMQYCNVPGDMALGINHRVSDDNWNNNETFWHGGDHNGYHVKTTGLPGKDSGLVVIMTGDGDDTNAFYWELQSSIRTAYGL